MRRIAVVVMLLPAIAGADPDYMPLTLGTPKVTGTGSIDVKSIMATMDNALDKLQPCYGATLARELNKSVTVTIAFSIGVDGKTSAVKMIGLDKASNACLVSAVSKLVFAKPKAKVAVSYPLQFGPPMPGGAFASLTGTGDISSGFDDSNIYGGLLGDEAGSGSAYGSGGFGGGGTGWGTIGTGRYGTIGHGSGSYKAPTTSIGQPSTQGDLDKAIIRRYIKRNLQKITYCYEKTLLAKPKLAGTVKVEFTIAVDGKVTSSKGSGLADVDTCVAGVIKGIEFPKPKGGEVLVTYPFTFRPADDAPAPAPAPAKP